MKNILLVDTSYTVFFRFNATKKWFSLAHAEEYVEIQDDRWLDNPIFKQKYQDMFMKGFEKHMKKLNIDEMLWAQDVSTQDVWRTKIYPQYKEGRDENITCKSDQVFTFTYNEFLPKFFKDNNLKYIKINTCEADDIIAVSSKFLSQKGNNVFIVSSDTDLIQLVTDKVKIYDLKMKELLPKISAEQDLKLKIIIGDKTDNISAIKPRLGKKTGEKLLNNEPELINLLKDPIIFEKYRLNQQLISFEMIPKKLEKEILKELKNYYK